jgi:hypothetical protein
MKIAVFDDRKEEITGALQDEVAMIRGIGELLGRPTDVSWVDLWGIDGVNKTDLALRDVKCLPGELRFVLLKPTEAVVEWLHERNGYPDGFEAAIYDSEWGNQDLGLAFFQRAKAAWGSPSRAFVLTGVPRLVGLLDADGRDGGGMPDFFVKRRDAECGGRGLDTLARRLWLLLEELELGPDSVSANGRWDLSWALARVWNAGGGCVLGHSWGKTFVTNRLGRNYLNGWVVATGALPTSFDVDVSQHRRAAAEDLLESLRWLRELVFQAACGGEKSLDTWRTTLVQEHVALAKGLKDELDAVNAVPGGTLDAQVLERILSDSGMTIPAFRAQEVKLYLRGKEGGLPIGLVYEMKAAMKAAGRMLTVGELSVGGDATSSEHIEVYVPAKALRSLMTRRPFLAGLVKWSQAVDLSVWTLEGTQKAGGLKALHVFLMIAWKGDSLYSVVKQNVADISSVDWLTPVLAAPWSRHIYRPTLFCRSDAEATWKIDCVEGRAENGTSLTRGGKKVDVNIGEWNNVLALEFLTNAQPS